MLSKIEHSQAEKEEEIEKSPSQVKEQSPPPSNMKRMRSHEKDAEKAHLFFFKNEARIWNQLTRNYTMRRKIEHDFKSDFELAATNAFRAHSISERKNNNHFTIHQLMRISLLEVIEKKYSSDKVQLTYDQILKIIEIRRILMSNNEQINKDNFRYLQYSQTSLDTAVTSRTSHPSLNAFFVERHRMPGRSTPQHYDWLQTCVYSIFPEQHPTSHISPTQVTRRLFC